MHIRSSLTSVLAAGALGVAAFIAVPAASAGAATPATYTVLAGDYLYSIGAKFSLNWQDIAAWNNIAGPDYVIQDGQVLKLSATTTPTPQPTPTVPPTAPPPASGSTYTVVNGDYLYLIGQKTGVDWQLIAQYNNIVSPYDISTGQVLKLTAGSTTPTPTPTPTPSPGKCSSGYVTLTFDDGPSSDVTPLILDALKAKGAHATFFERGDAVAAAPATAKRVIAEGNRIGNHSWDHPDLTTLTSAQIQSQFSRTQTAIRNATGVTPTQFRPPYGNTNATVVAAARAVGLTEQVLWTYDTEDWQKPPAQTIVDEVLASLKPGEIILFHDTYTPNTATAMPAILDGIASRGYCTS